jgi:hypothetical protein
VSPLFQHGPRPGTGQTTGVIPTGWVEQHRPVATATRTSPGTIHRVTTGPPPYPKPVGWTNETQVYSGMFRVQQHNREGTGTPGEQPTQERTYLVTASTDLPPLQAGERGDLIRVAGRELRVQQVLFGSLLWEIDLICTDNLTQQNPV